jgi:hypothetical protein
MQKGIGIDRAGARRPGEEIAGLAGWPWPGSLDAKGRGAGRRDRGKDGCTSSVVRAGVAGGRAESGKSLVARLLDGTVG